MAFARPLPGTAFLQDLASMKDDWDAIHAVQTHKAFFNSYDFIRIWYGSFAEKEQIRVLRAVDGGETIGFLPLYLKKKHGMRILSCLTNSHCFYWEPLMRPGHEDKFARLIFKELLRHKDTWDAIECNFIYSFSPSWDLFGENNLRQYDINASSKVEPTYCLVLNKPFNEYFERDLSSKTRHTLKRKINRVEALPAVRYIHLTGREAAQRFSDFEKIEGSGWKGHEGSSIDRLSGDYRNYYKEFIQHLATRNALHLNFLEVNGEFIAGIFGFVEGETFHSFKIGYNEEYSDYSPAMVLFIDQVKTICNEHPHIQRIHLFPWDFGYKHRFVNEQQYFRNTTIFSPTLKGRGIQSWYSLRSQLKRIPVLKPLAQLYVSRL